MKRFSKDELEALRNSGLFDEKWYLEQYPDVKMLGMDPLEHYLWVGEKLGRNPSDKFDGSYYLMVNADVAATGMNPLLHYVRWGRKEDRQTGMPTERRLVYRQKNKALGKPIVVYDSHNMKLQGAPNSLFEIASGIKRRGKFMPVLMTNALGPLAEAYEKREIECIAHGISPNRLLEVEQRLKYVQLLADHYKNVNASVVHANTLQNFHCILAAYQAGIPAIWNIRESEDPETYYDYLPEDLRNLAYSCFEKAAAVIFVAEATRRRWRKRLDGIVEHKAILNGLDISRLKGFVYNTSKYVVREELGVRSDDLMLLNVGTVTPRKGQHDLIDAIELLDKDKTQRIVLAFSGFNESNYSKDIMNRLDNLKKMKGLRSIKLNESATEADRRKVAELYLASDTFVLTSRVESYPRVILEAMEFGLSIIATPCFGVCEQLVSDESGLFYDEGDKESLARLIRSFLESPDDRRRFAQAARERLNVLNSYEQMLEAYEAMYVRVVDTSTSALRKTA